MRESHGRLPRRKDWDYRCGTYLVTFCTHKRAKVFGRVEKEKMILTPAGKLAATCWEQIPRHFPQVELLGFCLMPDHVHGVLKIRQKHSKEEDLNSAEVGPGHAPGPPLLRRQRASGGNQSSKADIEVPPWDFKHTLGNIVGSYKSAVSKAYGKLTGLSTPLWQTRFHDRALLDHEAETRALQYLRKHPSP